MYPTNTLRMRRGSHIVQTGKEAGQAIHHNISEDEGSDSDIQYKTRILLLQLEELPHEVSHPTQSPHV